MNGPRAISLFSGCGGSDLGLRQAGFDVVWANDISEFATKTYTDNLKDTTVETGDISTITTFPRAKLLVGCYPCQGFSQGGVRDAGSEINFLYREFDRVLRRVRPRAFIVENVDGMQHEQNEALLQNQLRRYRLAGYTVKFDALDAKDYGVAQTRKRVFIVGIRSSLKKTYDFPKPTHGPTADRPHVSQREALAGLPDWPEGEFCPEPLTWFYMSRNRRRDWDQPSACIVGHWRNVPLHPSSPKLERLGPDRWKFASEGRARRLSYRECARLQGFPENFKLAQGNVRRKFQLVGNAVPPPLFAAVAKALPEVWN